MKKEKMLKELSLCIETLHILKGKYTYTEKQLKGITLKVGIP